MRKLPWGILSGKLGVWLKRIWMGILALLAVGVGLIVLISLYGAISGRIINVRVDRELRAAGEPMKWEDVVAQPAGFETEEARQLDEVTKAVVDAYKKIPEKPSSYWNGLRWNNPASLKPYPSQPLDQPKKPAPPETWQDRDHAAAPLLQEVNRLQALNLLKGRLSQINLTYGIDVPSDRLNRRLELYRSLSSIAEIHLGCSRWNEAAQTVCLGYRLLEPTQTNDILIDQLIRVSTEGKIQQRCFEVLPLAKDPLVLRRLLKILGELPDYIALADKSLTFERLLFLNSTGELRHRIILWACSTRAFEDQRTRAQGLGEWAAVYYFDWCWMDRLLGQTKIQHGLYQKAWRETLAKQNMGACRLLEQNLKQDNEKNSRDASKLFVGALVNYQKKMVCADISRTLTRTAVAIRLFQLEKGRLPKTLEELVPTYLPEVPRDWGDGGVLRYRLESKDVYKLYSVGWDGQDQGGDPSDSEERQGTMGFQAERMKDILWPRIESAP